MDNDAKSEDKNERNNSVAKDLEILRTLYLQALPKKIKSIRDLINGLDTNGNADILKSVHIAAHSLCGTSATYGLKHLSMQARVLEHFVQKLIKNGNKLENAAIEKAQTLIDAVSISSDTSLFENEVIEHLVTASDAESNHHYTVLTIDDDDHELALLRSTLSKHGFKVVTSNNAANAIQMYSEIHPSLVIVDLIMPGMNGIELVRKIKSLNDVHYAPIIFLTSVSDKHSTRECIDAGGDDFINKPFDEITLITRIRAMCRIFEMHHELAKYKAQNEQEHELTQQLISYVFTRTNQDLDHVKIWSHSIDRFRGDCQLYRVSPLGYTYFFLGDFTGHGLASSLGTILITEAFLQAVNGDYRGEATLQLMNEIVHRKLPTGRYCAALLAIFDPHFGQVQIWNCGLPPALLFNEQGQIGESIESRALPLGITEKNNYTDVTHTHILGDNALLLAYSDGLTETVNSENEQYGEQRLLTVLQQQNCNLNDVVESIKKSYFAFADQNAHQDDVSVMALLMRKQVKPENRE